MKVLNLTATGCMGSGLVNALKDDPQHQVYGFTRNPDTPAAQKLKEAGVTLYTGSFNDLESLDKAMAEGFDAIFFTIFPDLAGGNSDLEQAEHIISAAKRNNIKQIIYGSVARTGTQENFDRVYSSLPETHFLKNYWRKKWALDQMIRDSGAETWTIIKPPTFIQNVVSPHYVAFMYPDLPTTHVFMSTLNPDLKIWFVDGSDVGKYAAAAIREPTKYHQKEITFGTELLNNRELVEKLSKASGKDVKIYEWTPEEWEATKSHPFLSSSHVMSEMGTDHNAGASGEFDVKLTTIDEWLENNKEGTWLA